MFHGSPQQVDIESKNPKRGRYDLCLTSERDVSEGYVREQSDSGFVYEVEVSQHGICPETVCEILDDCGIDRGEIGPDSPYFYLLMDRTDVQECLVEQGEFVVEYEDEDWDNEPHDCIRVLDPSVVDVVDVHEVN